MGRPVSAHGPPSSQERAAAAPQGRLMAERPSSLRGPLLLQSAPRQRGSRAAGEARLKALSARRALPDRALVDMMRRERWDPCFQATSAQGPASSTANWSSSHEPAIAKRLARAAAPAVNLEAHELAQTSGIPSQAEEVRSWGAWPDCHSSHDRNFELCLAGDAHEARGLAETR